jgi:hypothetical protein
VPTPIVYTRFILEHPTTKRWLTILAYGFIGALTVAFLGDRAAQTSRRFLSFLFGETETGPTLALFMIGMVGLIGMHSITQTRFGHLRSFLRYPPLPAAVILALVLTSFIPVIEDGWLSVPRPTLSACLAVSAFYAAIWMAPPILHWIACWGEGQHLAIPTPEEDVQSSLISDDELKAWLKREEPEGSSGMDLFGHSDIAERMLCRLGSSDTTIALHGDFGSGKSTVCNLMTALSERRRQPLIFVRTSPWGFDNASRAQKELLESVLRTLNEHVDVLGIRNLPTKYIEAVAGVSDKLSFLHTLHRLQRDPLDQLRRVTPLAAALGKRIVVIIEDLDRVGDKFDLGQISAMLMQLREVKGMSFILAISANQQIDFAKLCDHFESVPLLPATKVRNLLDQCREMLLRDFAPPVPLSEVEALGLPEIDDGSSIKERQPFLVRTWPTAISELLSRPRILKHVLRRICDVWPRLTGEVDIDDLISLTALRLAVPEAYQLIARRQDQLSFVQSSGEHHKEEVALIKEDLEHQWKRVMASHPTLTLSIATLLNRLLASAHVITGVPQFSRNRLQSMITRERGPIYAHRALTESLARPEASDQRMACILRGSKSDPSKLKQLSALIVHSRAAHETFEWLREPLRFEKRLELFSCVMDLLRTSETSQSLVGARVGEHLLSDIREMSQIPGFFGWLQNEVLKCVPGSLRLLTDIFRRGTEQLTDQDTDALRGLILARLEHVWSSSTPERIASGFDPSYGYTLFQLIFRPSNIRKGDYTDVQNWKWSAGPLLEAARFRPECVFPQILFALRSPAESPVYEMELEILRSWFGERARPLLLLIQERFVPPIELEATQRAILATVASEVNSILARLDERQEPTPSPAQTISPNSISDDIELIAE